MTVDDIHDRFSLPNLIEAFGRKPSILCVEDNWINATLILEILSSKCKVDHAISGEDAIVLTQNNQYDLILMDIGLGDGMNGIETTVAIHQVKGYENTPVAAVSGYLISYSKDELANAGIDYYLAKPFTKQQLLNLIQDILLKSIFSARDTLPDTPIGVP